MQSHESSRDKTSMRGVVEAIDIAPKGGVASASGSSKRA